ncbi:hypothetical protein D3875_04155 [Deinococcus cavernae]|uniref:Uncharacterized protein n=1 Tax=Deinococcus cavernae TaxID=2320857 RepID=A0A418VEE9_9DEIO|nr:hypothetical protein [Deinococcus cavernae]RJF74480.1 hypothetical protein D3875_04155 [Deinococcus cavernae]
MTQPHATRADIEAIVAARRTRAEQLKAEQTVWKTIPALPQTPAPTSATLTPLGVPNMPTPTAPAPQPVPDELTPEQIDLELQHLLTTMLPPVMAEVMPTVEAIKALFEPPFAWHEVPTAFRAALRLGEKIAATVSEAVTRYATVLHDLDAQALVDVLIEWLLVKLLKPYVPAWVFGALKPAIIGAVKMVYETKVRPQFKGQRLILAQ